MTLTSQNKMLIARVLFFVTTLPALYLVVMRPMFSTRQLYAIVLLEILALAASVYIALFVEGALMRVTNMISALCLVLVIIFTVRTGWNEQQTLTLMEQIGKDLLEMWRLLKPKGLDV